MERNTEQQAALLTAKELEKLIKAGRNGRYGRRDATLMLLMARHGLRVTEAIDLRWDQVDFSKGHLHVKLRREQQPESAFVFHHGAWRADDP
jgi:type 1 fimbriae regulatory protein FimB/type 1 fimbriae regulatory protein FimE